MRNIPEAASAFIRTLFGKETSGPVPYLLTMHFGKEKKSYRLEFQRTKGKENGTSGLDDMHYIFNGRTYVGIQSLWAKETEELSDCVFLGKDLYGEGVLKLYTQIPSFDPADREWDSKKLEFLFFDGKEINLAVMRGGYRIAGITFYDNLLTADSRLRPYFEKLGWPTNGIKWK